MNKEKGKVERKGSRQEVGKGEGRGVGKEGNA